MQYVKCNLCGADNYRVVFAAGQAQPNRVVRCRVCGLMYGNPRSNEIDAVRVSAYDPGFLDEVLERQHNPRIDKEEHQVVDYADTRALLAQHFPYRGDLLEVGSGYGYLCDEFRRDGWRVFGVDPDRLACRYAEEVLRVPVFRGLLHDAALPDASRDAILMMHVIEHVPDPARTLDELMRILRPGGMLVMETPRFDSLAFRLLGARERSMVCEGHIYFFTTDTLTTMAERAGFGIVRHDIVGRSLSLDRVLWNVGVISKSDKVQARLAALSQRLGLWKWRVKLNARDMQRLVLIKAR